MHTLPNSPEIRPKSSFANRLPTIPPLPLRRGEGRGEGSSSGQSSQAQCSIISQNVLPLAPFLFFFAFLLLTSSPLLAAESPAYSGPRWDFLDAKKVLADAAEVSQAKFPDCDEATVEKKMVRVYRADGTGECQDESFVKVLTEKGKRNNRSLSLYHMLPYSTAQAIKVEVMKSGGQVVTVDVAANSKEMIDDSQMGMNIYDPNMKILRVNIPNVEVGDIVHSITRTTIERSIIPGEFADDNLFEGAGYIHHLSYEVYAPNDKPLKRVVLRDQVAGTVAASTQPIQ